jgi:hypothetical protein
MATLNDLSIATRELFVRTVKHQVYMQTPVLEELQRRSQITYSGGKYIERLVDTDEVNSLAQAYTTNEALSDGKKDTLEKPRFLFKLLQQPMKYDVDEYLQNHNASSEEQLLDLASFLVEKSQRGIKLALRNMMYNVTPDGVTGSESGTSDSSKYFSSLISALDHNSGTAKNYGNISRSFTNNAFWMGSDPLGRPDAITSSSQGTATNVSIANFRKWLVPIEQYMEKMSDLYVVMCPTLWNKLRAELEAKGQHQSLNADKLKYGIHQFEIDGAQIVKDPYLEHGYGTGGTTENWVFVLNLRDWELRIHKDRNMKQTEFKWQGEIANGHDYWLARILCSGNLCCWKPNGSMWLNNVS